MYKTYIYIYIYIEREREREGSEWRRTGCLCKRGCNTALGGGFHPVTSLPFALTARRSYRLSDPVNNSDCISAPNAKQPQSNLDIYYYHYHYYYFYYYHYYYY